MVRTKGKNPHFEYVGCKFPIGVVTVVDELARKEHRTRSNTILHIVAEHLNEIENKGGKGATLTRQAPSQDRFPCQSGINGVIEAQ